MSTCATSVKENPRITCHYGLVNCLQRAENYLKYTSSIDIHNHYHTGSCCVKNTWHTTKPHLQQFEGVLRFCFTNSYLTYKFFCNKNVEHCQFKMATAQAFTSCKGVSLSKRELVNTTSAASAYSLVNLSSFRRWYIHWYGYGNRGCANLCATFQVWVLQCTTV